MTLIDHIVVRILVTRLLIFSYVAGFSIKSFMPALNARSMKPSELYAVQQQMNGCNISLYPSLSESYVPLRSFYCSSRYFLSSYAKVGPSIIGMLQSRKISLYYVSVAPRLNASVRAFILSSACYPDPAVSYGFCNFFSMPSNTIRLNGSSSTIITVAGP